MDKLLINISNHPVSLWSEKQIEAAKVFGNLIDMPFPDISPLSDENEIDKQSENYKNRIMSMKDKDVKVSVHLMGEMTFTYSLARKLIENDIDCYASTSKRMVSYNDDGDKVTHFEFARFRKYT